MLTNQNDTAKVQLLFLQPAHFHAALILKYPNEELDSELLVFAESESSYSAFKELINQYNAEEVCSKLWKLTEFHGEHYLEKAFKNNQAQAVVLAGNNSRKIDFIEQAVSHHRAVFADKPLVIDVKGYNKLKKVFQKKGFVFDMMTERYAVKNQIIKHLVSDLDFSGGIVIQDGKPSISFESTHHFIKNVAGKALLRPAKYYNVEEQGEGIVDVTAHFIDLAQWILSSEQSICIEEDIQEIRSEKWSTPINKNEFYLSTGLSDFPEYLDKYVNDQGVLEIYSNGKIEYLFKKYPISISVDWDIMDKEGHGDCLFAQFLTHSCLIEIKPDANHISSIYLTPTRAIGDFEKKLERTLGSIQEFTGLKIEKQADSFKIIIPKSLYLAHEDHFSKVLKQFLTYRKEGLPDWEKTFMLTKYYLTTHALANAVITDKK